MGRSTAPKDTQEATRLRAAALFPTLGNAPISQRLNVNVKTVAFWRTKYRRGGIDALRSRPDKGKPSRLTLAQVEAVTRATHGKSVTLAQIAAWIQAQWGVRLGKTRVWQLAHKHGWAQWRG